MILEGLYVLNRDMGSRDAVVGASYWLALSIGLNLVAAYYMVRTYFSVPQPGIVEVVVLLAAMFACGFVSLARLRSFENGEQIAIAPRSKSLAILYVGVTVLLLIIAFALSASGRHIT